MNFFTRAMSTEYVESEARVGLNNLNFSLNYEARIRQN